MSEEKFFGLQQHAIGNPQDVISTIELKIPELQDDQVLVDLIASPINYGDAYGIKGMEIEGFNLPTPQFPTLLGGEGTAKIVKTGTGVSNVQISDHVILPLGSKPWRERFVISSQGLFPIPKTHELQLSMLTVSPQTAYGMLKDFQDLKQGDWIIQNAANSSVGCCVIGLAKWMGLKTINIVRRNELIETLKSIGADHVVVDSADVIKKIQEIEGVGNIKLGLDAVGGKSTNKLAAVLSPGGTIVSYGVLESQFIQLNAVILLMKNLSVHGFYTGFWYQKTDPEKQHSLLKKFIELVTQDRLKVPIEKTYSLRSYKEALTHAIKSGRKGKIVFTGPGYEST
ncbi:MAG: zinc-dependent alcohol dehydrogenase family protein [Promethearchaeota archaeon]